MDIKIIRSKRKTISMEIRSDGLLVRAPIGMPDAQIEKFLSQHRRWIDIHQRKMEEQIKGQSQVRKLTQEDIRKLADQALTVIPERVRYYAPKAGVTYGSITIRNQKTRWGSCSAKGNLNFNCLLMLTPPEVIDSVVVHELCHRLEMNHSAKFYKEVYRVFPEYDKWNGWLKEHGQELLRKMTG